MKLTRSEPSRLTRWEPFREMEEMFRRYSPFFARAPFEGREETEWVPWPRQ